MSEWQDISTAPKDGTRVRLWAGGVEHHGKWSNDPYSNKPRPYWRIETYMGKTWERKNQPTHWMHCAAAPLPSPPKAA